MNGKQMEDLRNKLSQQDFQLSYAEGNKLMKKSCSSSEINQLKGEDQANGIEQHIHEVEEQLKVQSQLQWRSQDFCEDPTNSNQPMELEKCFST